MKGIILGTLITVFTSTQLLASSPVLPPFSGITQSTTHAITIDNNSDSQFQLTLSPGGAYDVLPNYGYQIPVAPNTQYNLAAVNAVQTTSTASPRVDYSETTEALPYGAAPTSLAGQVASGVAAGSTSKIMNARAFSLASGGTSLGANVTPSLYQIYGYTITGVLEGAASSSEADLELMLTDGTHQVQFGDLVVDSGTPQAMSFVFPSPWIPPIVNLTGTWAVKIVNNSISGTAAADAMLYVFYR